MAQGVVRYESFSLGFLFNLNILDQFTTGGEFNKNARHLAAQHGGEVPTVLHFIRNLI